MTQDQTIATYDTYADVYDAEVVDFWEQFPSDFIDRFVAALPGTRVLNLGSGSGRDAVLLRDRGLEVVCLDASRTMVQMTAEMGFESHHATFADMDFPDGSFDGVWAYTSLIHVPAADAAAALRAVRAMLRPDGALIVGAIEGDEAGMVERKTMPGTARYFKKYRRDELRQLVESAGFTFRHEQDYQPHNSIYLNQLYAAA